MERNYLTRLKRAHQPGAAASFCVRACGRAGNLFSFCNFLQLSVGAPVEVELIRVGVEHHVEQVIEGGS